VPIQIPPVLRSRLEPLPFPMRFSDGRIRLTTLRLRLLKRVWALVGGMESSRARSVYRGGDVLDVGAFHGWYSVLLAPHARPGDHLVSFEPDPAALPMLRSVVGDVGRWFGDRQLAIVTEPVGDGGRVAEVWPGEGYHPRFGQVAEDGAQSVPSLTVDAYVAAHGVHPTFVKIDVEGAEFGVLTGMKDTLAHHRPVVVLEIHTEWLPEGITADDVEDLIRGAGYACSTNDDATSIRRQIWLPVGDPGRGRT
jgi:FkbM family methyltransferase